MNCDFFKNKFLRKTLASWCAFATLATMCGPAWAAVATGDYLGGAANLNGASAGVENYGAQTANYAGFTAAGGTGVLDWNKLNVPGSTTMEFNNGTFYNVVNSAGGMSTIAGAINGTSGANVYIFNPNGIVFNSGSSVDVGGVFGALATGVSGEALTSWMANPTDVPAAIQNAKMTGDITVDGGDFKASQLAFAGKNVAINGGTFNGATKLAAGDKVAIDGFGGGTISMKIPDATRGNVEFDGMSTFEDALVVKAGGQVLVGNGSDVTVKGADGFVIASDASGDAAVGAKAFHVDNSKITVTQGKLTAQVGDRIAVVGSSDVSAKSGVKLTVADGDVEIGDGFAASVRSSDGTVSVTANGGSITMGNGGAIVGKDVELTAAGTEASSKDITMEAGSSVTANGNLAMTSEKGSVIEAAGATIVADGNATFKATAGDITLAGTANDFSKGGDGSVVNAEAKTVTINEGVDNISLGNVKSTEGDIRVTAKGAVIANNGAKVEAKGNLDVDAAAIEVRGASEVTAGKNVRLAAAGDTTLDSKVTAGKNLTVIGKNVAQNADLETTDGSVYVEATGGDIVMAAGTKTIAGKKVRGSTDGTGNILYKATGDVKAQTGGATLEADPVNNDGAIVLHSENGSIGENMTLKAARMGLVSKGDIKTHLVGDVTFAARSETGSIEVDHEQGTLTVDTNPIADGDKVVKVLTVDSTEDIQMKPLAGEVKGLEAARHVHVDGHDGSSVVVARNAGVIARSRDARIGVDRNILVNGFVDAATDVRMSAGRDVDISGSAVAGRFGRVIAGRNTTVRGTVQAVEDLEVGSGGNLATPDFGKLVAGRDLRVDVGSSTPQINISVGKGVSARSGERSIAFKTVGGYAYPEVYGNNSETAVFIDGRIAGGNSADFSILQGYEQVSIFGNFLLNPVFTRAANFFPLTWFTDMQSPAAAFVQGYLFSTEKGKITGMSDER